MSTTASQMAPGRKWCVIAEHARFSSVEDLVQSIGMDDARQLVELAADRAAAAADRMALIERLHTHGEESQNRACLWLHPDGGVRMLVVLIDLATDSEAAAERLAQDLHRQVLAESPESDAFFGVTGLDFGPEASQ